MSDSIPFVNTERDCQILQRFFPDATAVRASGEAFRKVLRQLPASKIWADAGVDGLDQWPPISESFKQHISSWSGLDRIADPDFQKKPDRVRVSDFVDSVLNQICSTAVPGWISVPQLPCTSGPSRNKLNRQLANSAARWQLERHFKGRMVLPFIVTHLSQIRLKQERNKRVELVRDCLGESGATVLWVVDRSLNDLDGAASVGVRLRAVIDLHEQVREGISREITVVAGPYWGLNLILWCRGLAHHPAVGMGNAFQYRSPGGHIQPGKTRLAIGALKRLVVASDSLRTWLESSIRAISKSDPTIAEIASLLRAFPHLLLDGRPQVAAFYSQWLDRLQQLPLSGRSLALYQDFSSAYVFGRTLGVLPKEEGSARRPERIAEQLMLHCL